MYEIFLSSRGRPGSQASCARLVVFYGGSNNYQVHENKRNQKHKSFVVKQYQSCCSGPRGILRLQMPGHCLFSIYPVRVLGGDNFGPRSILCLQPVEKRQLLGTSGVFVCHIRASEDTVAPALRDCLVFPPCPFPTSGITLAPAVGDCLVSLSVNSWP